MECLFCIRRCFGVAGPASFSLVKENVLPAVVLDTATMGDDVVIVKSGRRICGAGAAVSNAPVVQNKAYFEVKVQQTGVWAVGLATSEADLNRCPGGDGQSWALRNDGRLMHDNREQHNQQSTQAQPVQEGDVIGVTFDHVELRFLVNNRPLEACLTGVKGRQLFPVVFVDDGAILDVFFDGFQHEPPSGFDRILVEKSLL